jgi:O-antigen/teichoic acid export membrane protein
MRDAQPGSSLYSAAHESFWTMSAKLRTTLVFGFADQALISLGSLLILICAAQGLGAKDFGYFTLAVATVGVGISIVRALSGETLVAGSTQRPPSDEVSSMLGLVFVLALCASAIAVTVGLLWPSSAAAYFGAAIVMPGALLQDAVRYALIYKRKSRFLVIFDLATVAAECALVLVVSLTTHSPFLCLVTWALIVSTGSCLTLLVLRIRASPGAGLTWLRLVWKQSSAYATESILGALVGYTIIIVIALVASAEAVAAFRTTVTVFGLTSLVVNFIRSTYMRELSGSPSLDAARVKKTYVQLSLLMLIVVAFAAGVLALIPEEIGKALFGDTWLAVTSLLLVGALNRYASSLTVIPTVLLRVMGVTWQATAARTIIAIVSLGLGPVGALLAGASGALIAESVTYTFIFIVLTRIVGHRFTGGARR